MTRVPFEPVSEALSACCCVGKRNCAGAVRVADDRRAQAEVVGVGVAHACGIDSAPPVVHAR